MIPYASPSLLLINLDLFPSTQDLHGVSSCCSFSSPARSISAQALTTAKSLIIRRERVRRQTQGRLQPRQQHSTNCLMELIEMQAAGSTLWWEDAS
uniref:Uncharacterized protein n=1 Tax=Knipowitschia caucasica TaxID=637954 RepID=A0AAV2L2H0_KNICA